MDSISTGGCGMKLPSPVLTMASQANESDQNQEAGKHDGRTRSFPHERGIWASYVFIDCNDIEGLHVMQRDFEAYLNAYATIDMKPIDRMHLSLTKTFIIHHHNIASLVNNLQEMVSVQKHFRLEFDGIDVYVNEEQTRTFLGVRVAVTTCDALGTIVASLDECMQQYKLPKYYVDRSFHVSILWCLGDMREELRKHLQALSDVFERVYEEEYSEMNSPVRKILFKCGNKTFYFQLV